MSEEGHIPNPPPAKRLLVWTGVAFAVAALVTVGFVAPAEFHLDPLGIGKLTGLDRLAGQKEVEVKPARDRRGPRPPRRPAAIDGLPHRRGRHRPAGRRGRGQRARIQGADEARRHPGLQLDRDGDAGRRVLFRLPRPDDPGHAQGEIQVATYRQATGAGDNGSLIAPLDGVHGWYLQNQGSRPPR